MGLIDANEMLKRLESWNTDDEMDKALYNFTLNRIIEQPPVEAIPIEWVEKYAELLSTIDRTFCKLQAIQIRVMLNDWYVEQANQNKEQENEHSEDGSEVE